MMRPSLGWCCFILFLGGTGLVTAELGSSKYLACEAPCVPGDESLMSPKEHGTSHTPVQSDLRWGVEVDLADRISNYNRRYAERSGYWETTSFLAELNRTSTDHKQPLTFYDSNSGRPLFRAPRQRSWDDFLQESRAHGWPSFRDAEVIWENVRVLPHGETVSIDSTHLGHNIPDQKGRRYCINLVSIAGYPNQEERQRHRREF